MDLQYFLFVIAAKLSDSQLAFGLECGWVESNALGKLAALGPCILDIAANISGALW